MGYAGVATFNGVPGILESASWFSIRAYVYAMDPALLPQQKEEAIKATTSYSPTTVTTSLPWAFFKTAFKESDLRSAVMGNVTETPNSATVAVTDRHICIRSVEYWSFTAGESFSARQ